MEHKTIDDVGNELSVAANGKVMLKLASEERARAIGVISEGKLFVERDSFRHLHRKSNSYGFNYHLLKDFDTFSTVMLKENGATTFAIPKERILEDGQIMFFKKARTGSFELQIFLNKNDIQIWKQ
jgi:hypothetical protein